MTTIKDFLPNSYKRPDLPNMAGILAAIRTGDEHVINLLTSARRQLFLTNAESGYLTNLANQFGFAIPPNSGLDQTGFRALAIPAIWSPKQSIPTINRITELFYSSAVLHPVLTATVLDKYVLTNNDTLLFETEDGIIPILFEAIKFADITNVSASEVSSTINSQANGQIVSDIVLDRTSQRYFVRVIGKNFGSAAKIRCIGGSAQNVIKFQDIVATTIAPNTTWNVTKFASAVYSNIVRFTWDGIGTNPGLYALNFNDNVSIRGLVDGAFQLSLLNGSFRLLNVGADYFEVENLYFPHSGISFVQVLQNQIVFTSQEYRTLFDNEEYAIVSETSPGVLDVSIPAVPPIVRRPIRGATRLRGGVADIETFEQSKVLIPSPNLFPESGTFVLDSLRYNEGMNDRYFKYTSKGIPAGGFQSLNVDPAGPTQVPFVSAAEAAIALSVIQDLNPIFGDVDKSDIIIDTQGVEHRFENAQEIEISGATISIQTVKHKTVPGIFCPIGQDSTYFENDMDSDRLYIQFYVEDTKELMHLVYEPDLADPTNRTRFYYLPELEGRFVKAVIINMSNGIFPNDVTATIGPAPLNAGGGTTTFTHNFGTPFSTFMPVSTIDGHNITGQREVVNNNDVQFTYSEPSGAPNIKVYALDYQNVFPSLVRAVATNFFLPASPASVTSRTLVHNLFSSSVIVEIRVTNPGTTQFPDNNFVFFPKVVIIDDTKFEIQYDGTIDDLYVDVFIIASFFNPLESVHGGILESELNDEHIVRRRYDQFRYSVEILGTGPSPYGAGTITSSGKNVTGIGTSFLTEVSPGDFIYIPNGQKRPVQNVISNTSILLKAGFNPSVGAPVIYKIVSPEANDTPFGVPVSYYGAIIFGFNVIYLPDANRGTDIRFEFPDRVSRGTAGFVNGTSVKLIEGFGFDIQPAVAAFLRSIPLTVHSQEGQYVYFKANIGASAGNIIVNAKARRSGFFGASAFTHHLPVPLSQWNEDNWFKERRVILLDSDLPPNDQYVGSYVYDTIGDVAPYTIGSASSTLLTPVTAFSAPGILDVSTLNDFPASGYIFLDFGNSAFEGPIRYSLTIPGSPAQIRIDPAYIFKQSHEDNAIVRLAASIFKPVIKTDGSQFPVYVTGSVEARRTLEQILRELVSVGVKLNVNVRIPELRYFEPSIQPFL